MNCVESMALLKNIWEKIGWEGITALGTMGLVLTGIKISKRISFKRELMSKQLETVFNLVGLLQEIKIYIQYNINITKNGSDTDNGDIYYRFFDISQTKISEHVAFRKTNVTLHISEDFLYNNEVMKFIQNPFLPKSIAESLINISPRGGNQIKHTPGVNQIFISDDRKYDAHTYRSERSVCYSNMLTFASSFEDVKKNIYAWLSYVDVKDLNIIDKPINFQNYQ